MLIAPRPLGHAGNMKSSLVAKGARADIGRKGVRGKIGHLAYKT